jgi:hypothetical protein
MPTIVSLHEPPAQVTQSCSGCMHPSTLFDVRTWQHVTKQPVMLCNKSAVFTRVSQTIHSLSR